MVDFFDLAELEEDYLTVNQEKGYTRTGLKDVLSTRKRERPHPHQAGCRTMIPRSWKKRHTQKSCISVLLELVLASLTWIPRKESFDREPASALISARWVFPWTSNSPCGLTRSNHDPRFDQLYDPPVNVLLQDPLQVNLGDQHTTPISPAIQRWFLRTALESSGLSSKNAQTEPEKI